MSVGASDSNLFTKSENSNEGSIGRLPPAWAVYGAEIFAAASSTLCGMAKSDFFLVIVLVAPAIAIIDKSIFSNASGKERMGQSIKNSVKKLVTTPRSSPSICLLFNSFQINSFATLLFYGYGLCTQIRISSRIPLCSSAIGSLLLDESLHFSDDVKKFNGLAVA